MKKQKKQMILLMFAILSFVCNIQKCNAHGGPNFSRSIETSTSNNSDGKIKETIVDISKDKPIFNGENLYGYAYGYKDKSSYSKEPLLDVKDMDGISVVDDEAEIKEGNEFKAGTWVSINSIENKTVTWKITELKYYQIVQVYKCTYYKEESKETKCGKTKNEFDTNKKDSCKIGKLHNGKTICEAKLTENEEGSEKKYHCEYKYNITTTIPEKYYSENEEHQLTPDFSAKKDTCKNPPKGYTFSGRKKIETKYTETKNKNKINALKAKAIDDIYNKWYNTLAGFSTELNYDKSNKINESEPGKINATQYKTLRNESCNLEGKKCQKGKNIVYSEKGKTTIGGTIFRVDQLNPLIVCINVKTSNVSYGRKCDAKTEMEVKNFSEYNTTYKTTLTYWPYFIPLDAKSKSKKESEFYIGVEQSVGSELLADDCRDYIEKYKKDSEYCKFLIPATGKFECKYKKGKIENYKDYKLFSNEKKKCRYVVKTTIPITQEFYKEITEAGKTSFEGFNFYYKPIDISEPFPNNLSSASIWKEWDKKGRKNPNLSQSFVKNGKANITYYTENLNVNAIEKIDEEIKKDYKSDDSGIEFNSNLNWTGMIVDGRSKFIDKNSIVKRNVNIKNFYKLGCGPYNESWEGCKKS